MLVELLQGMTPTKASESCVVSVGGDPLTSPLNGQCGEIGIGHQIALGAAVFGKTTENVVGLDKHIGGTPRLKSRFG